MDDIPHGYCKCGCGQKTFVPQYTWPSKKWIKGQPIDYVRYHNPKPRGEKHFRWNGGRCKDIHSGYVKVLLPEHPRASQDGYVPEHIIIAEKSLGKFLPDKAVVHHINGIRDDNRPQNLVVCENSGYHQTLHRREKALKASGHASWRKCQFCKQYDDPVNLKIEKSNAVRHPKCRNIYQREYRQSLQSHHDDSSTHRSDGSTRSSSELNSST